MPKDNLLMHSLKNGIIVGVAVLVLIFIILAYINPSAGITSFSFNTAAFLSLEAAFLALVMGALVTWLLQK
jgi:uncharacterized integral membrane protein